MSIKTIEVMCLPCPKCEQLRDKIAQVIKGIEMQNKVKIPYEFKHTPHLKDISKYSLGPSQAPVVIINGKVEFAGRVELPVLKMRLEVVNRM